MAEVPSLRVVLLYAPPWKIPRPGHQAPAGQGPPEGFEPHHLDADFHQVPWGLLSLAAQALAAGHRVKVLNLSAMLWEEVTDLLDTLRADVWGLSCWTANRRGVSYVSDEIKRRDAGAWVVLGGPHATPLAEPIMARWGAVDAVVRGEGEATFGEILARRARGEPIGPLPGAIARVRGVVVDGGERPLIQDLDQLATPHRYFDTHITLTSRGCPWRCTFCGAETTWGRGVRGPSVEVVLDALQAALARLPVRQLQIKDDTFTANRKRALAICRGIRERGLSFIWSCDTRVDVLDEELVREMRLAGCERMSLGVESGSAKVLKLIGKKVGPDEIRRAAELARSVGIRVRFYMMVGNRGETPDTLAESLQFLHDVGPDEYLFTTLSIYPGTPDFHDGLARGVVTVDDYFDGDFIEYRVAYDAPPEHAVIFEDFFQRHRGLRSLRRQSVADARAVLGRLGPHPGALFDLATALAEEGELAEAERVGEQALAAGHPTPGLVKNLLAAIALGGRRVGRMQDLLLDAARTDPQHAVLIENVQRVQRWLAERGPELGSELLLDVRRRFRVLEKTRQPTLPGPIAPGELAWPDVGVARAAAPPPARLPVMR